METYTDTEVTYNIYRTIFERQTRDFIEDDYYIKKGEPKIDQGWILHISISVAMMCDFLNTYLAIILKYQVPFKVIKSPQLHDYLNSGLFGDFKTGKVITLYFDDEKLIDPIMEDLLPIAKNLGGPIITTDFPINSALYTRYGRFHDRFDINSFGDRFVRITVNKQKIIDRYYTPPFVPREVNNPFFKFIAAPPKPARNLIIGDKAMPVKLIKRNVKGNVWLGLYLHKRIFLWPCVIKQGIQGMYPDILGRDMIDRLETQATLSRILEKKSSIPPVINLVKERKYSYLIIKYIWFGRDYIRVVREKTKRRPWSQISSNCQRVILNHLINIVNQIKILHDNNIIHRDIAGTNFFIDFMGKTHLIDIELAYSVTHGYPTQPFRGGTPGYMSPQQAKNYYPSTKDDIYSLGALLLMTISGGIEPFYFLETVETYNLEKIHYLCQDRQLTNIIGSCLSSSPEKRPSIDTLFNQIIAFGGSITSKASPQNKRIIIPDNLKKTIQYGVNSISSDLMSYNDLWFSRIDPEYGMEVYPYIDKHTYWSLYRGVGGIIAMFTILKKNGFEISEAEPYIKAGLDFIEQFVLQRLDKVAPSFLFGKSGIAYVLHNCIQQELLPNSSEIKAKLKECFSILPDQIDFAEGLSGIGLAAMHCSSSLDCKDLQQILVQIDFKITSSEKNINDYLKKENIGFAYGLSGISYFLLESSKLFNNSYALVTAERILDKVLKISKKKELRQKQGWATGPHGVSLAFLKGYTMLNDKKYLRQAKLLLSRYPNNQISNDLTQSYGMSGIGESFLEAFQITQDQEWLDRATQIANHLLKISFHKSERQIYWLPESPKFPTADFMVGNSGIIHFLLRYLKPGNVAYPLLMEK